SRWQLAYCDVLRCLRPSDLRLSNSMPRSGRMCPGFGRYTSSLPGVERRINPLPTIAEGVVTRCHGVRQTHGWDASPPVRPLPEMAVRDSKTPSGCRGIGDMCRCCEIVTSPGGTLPWARPSKRHDTTPWL